MKRFNINHKYTDNTIYSENQKIDLFLDDIIEVCVKHNLKISHEDYHGAFEIFDLEDDENFSWLLEAHDGTRK